MLRIEVIIFSTNEIGDLFTIQILIKGDKFQNLF